MSKALKIAVSGVSGTSFMTLFSYILSGIEKENFSEPGHLSKMLDRIQPGRSRQFSHAAGWAAHYGIGLLFAAVYVELWEQGTIKPSAKSAVMLGAPSGLLAILAWKAAFRMHPAPPWINHNKFYTQLAGAHIVFALFCSIAYRATKHRDKEQADR